MPNWKKLIISGSDAALNSLSLTDGLEVTGSVNISGSTTQIGTNKLLGNTLLSGSLTVSGSYDTVNPSVRIYGDTQLDGVIRFDPINTSIDTNISASYIYVSGSTEDLYFSQNGRGYSNITRLRWLEGNVNTGLLYGGIVDATAGTTTFDVSAGEGLIVSMNAFTGSEGPNPTFLNVAWPDLTNQTLTYLTTADTTWLLINSNGTLIQQTTAPTDLQFRENIQVGVVLHPNRTNITLVKSFTQPSYAATQQLFTFVRSFGGVKLNGHIVSANGTNLSLNRSEGTAFAIGRNYAFDPDNPSLMSDAAASAPNLFRYHASGSEFVTTTGTTLVDPDNYNTPNSATGLSSMDPNKFQIQRIFFFPKSPDTLGIYYGRQQYNTVALALQNLPYEEFVENDNTRNQAIFLGYLIVESGTTDLSNINEARFLQAGAFRTTGAGGAAGAPIVTNLEDLNDVTIASAVAGDLISWNGAEWQNKKQLTGTYGITGSLGITSTLTVEGNISGSGNLSLSNTSVISLAPGSAQNKQLTIYQDTSDNSFIAHDGLGSGKTLRIGEATGNRHIAINGTDVTLSHSALLLKNQSAATRVTLDMLNQRFNFDGSVTGSIFTGSFAGDGSALTNITAEWDGSHNGDAEITGSLIVSGSGVELEVFGDIQLRHSTQDALKLGGAGDLYGTSGANSVILQKPGRSQFFQFGTQTGYFQVGDGTNNIFLRAESTPEVSVSSTGALSYVINSGTNNNNGNVLTWSNTTSGNGERGRVSIVGDLRLDDYSSGTASNAVNIENNGDAYFSGSVGIGIASPTAKLNVKGTGTTDATTALLIENSAGTDLLKVTDDGTTTLGELSLTDLTVSGTASIAYIDVQFVSSSIIYSSGSNIFGDADDDVQTLNGDMVVNDTDLFVDASTSRVGIGTTSPSAKLDVEGDINVVNANISNQENTDVDTGTEVVATLEIATYTAGFFDFVIKKGTNVRSGTIYACHDGTSVVHTETTTIDLGDTSDVDLTIDISGGDMRLTATALSDDWSIKSLVRGL